MPNKVTYTITTADGKEHQVSKENVDKYGIQSYADAYKGATIRMRDAQKGDYDIPLQHFDNARKQGLHAFSLEHTPVQKQAAPKPTPTSTAKPTPSPSVNPRQSTPQVSKPLLSDSFGKGTGTDFLKPKPVGYNLSEEHRNEVLGEQAKRSATPSNPHVQRAVQLGKEAKAKRVEREQKRFGKPTIAKAFDDAVHGDKKAAKELGMPQVMQQKKDEIDYMQATGKELRNPVDAGLTYDENGDVVHSMFAPTVARDEHGNIVTNEAGEPLVGISSDEARAKAYGDSVQTGIEAQREKDKVDNLYKDAVESVNDAFDEDYKKKEAFRKEHPFLGAVSDALEGFSNRGNALQYTPEGAKPGLAALGMMTKAAQMKENADRYGDAGTLSRLYGGIMAGLTDVDTYDFGITDTFNAANLYRAAKNYEEGKATAKDKMLLDAAAIANNVQSEASDKLGGAFGAGQNLVGTIGFMAQMATNPASGIGKEAAASVAKTVAKRALQRFGKGAIAKAVTGLAKGATRVGMDAVEAGVVTGMYSPTKIVGDYLNRKTGDVQSDGKGGYIFQNKEYSDVKALAKAINGQYAENISEMWGEYLPGVGKVNAAIGRGARKIGLGKVVDAFEHMSSSNWAKTWKNFQERTKWNGMAGEYFEEVANNLYNAVTNGDMTLDTDPHTGVFNPKINLDTFYSVALMSGIMSGVNTAGYARERYKAPHEQRKADAQARSVFGERWDEYKNAIDNADEKQIGSVMEKIGSDKSLSNSQKIAALQYQYRTAVVHGVNAQDTKNKLEGQFNAMDEAYSMGYNLHDEKELNNTAILYDEAKKQATKATGWNEDTLESMIGEDGGASTLAYMKHSDEFNDGQLQAFTDYANARAAYNGMIQRAKDDIDTKVHESELVVDQRTNLDTGAIHPATMKVDDRQVYIVNGNVVMLPDGSGVDHEHSDDFIVLRDAETGELETADPSAIFKVDAPINVQEEKEVAADNIRQTFAHQQADKIDGKLEFKQGDTYSIIDKEDGTQHSLSIIGDAIDEKTGQVNPEMVLVDIDGAQQPTLLPKEQVQQQVDEARRAAVAATQVVENAPTTNTNNTYSINDEVTLSDENGNTVRGSITAPENEDGKFEVYTEQPINGKKVNLFSAEELDAMTKAPETVTENATVQQPQQQEETEDSVEKETSQQQTTALERIPKDESGQPLYEQTEPETAWDAIVEQTEGDTSMAQTVADDMVSDLEAGVKKAEKTKTKSGGSIAEKIAAEKERAAVIEQAKATLAHWRKIAAVNRMREAAIQAEEQRKADEVARVRKEQEEKERVEQEEAERIKREALNGVPDFVEDKATDARARGYRRVNGDKVDRQEPINATKGKEVQVKFDDDNIPTGHVAIIEANQLQPSHKNGQRNPQHFIDEAQPKERKDDASVGAARKIAANIRPEEITSSITAYTGAPTVNSRGEVIQGNNRSAALREMWDNHQEQGDKYKQYLIDHAESFGLRPEDIAAMDKPVLVNMLDVNDDEAISLGQFVASDTESGGTERIKPKNVVKKLGDKMKNFANILLRANDENISFAELVDSNGVDALKWLNANGVISPTQYKSAFDSKGNITAEAKNDIKGIMYQSIFEGGNTQLEEMFNALPAKAQKAILATAYRDYDSPQSERMIGDIQDSIMAYYALSHDSMFMNAKNHKDARIAVEAWRRQLAFDDVTGESYLPAEKYSNFALLLATMYKGDNQSLIQGTFNKMYDLIQGTQEETLFEQPDNTPRSLAQAIKETLNIEYNGQQGSNVLAGDNSASQEGRTGSNGDATSRGRSEDIDGAEANQGGTERDTGRSGEERVEKADEGAYSLSQQKSDNGENFYQDINGNIDLANIPDEVFNKINKPQAPFRLTPSMLKHVFDRHGKEMGLSKADDAIDFVLDVIDNFDHVRQGEKGAIIFSIENGRSRTGRRAVTVLLDSLSGSYYGIKTSGYERIEGLTKRTLLWEKGAKDTSTTGVAPANVSTEQASQSNEPAGSASNHNNDFEGKDKQSSATKQEIVDNYLEKPASSEDLFAKAERVAEEDKAKRTRKKEEAKVDTNPTEAQKEAGNYKKGHIKVDGFNVTIEQPKGSVRRDKDANGKEWETEMHNTYGYIRGTESVDGDHIDIFLSDNPTEGNVFVVDQVNKDGSFDEHKVMYGFSDMESARKAYLSNYEEGWQGLGNITEVSKEEFKKWIDSSKRKTKPFAEYSSVKTEGDVNVQRPIEDNSGKRLVSNERYEELKKRMRSKLGQLNLGVDPEMLAIGAEMAVYHIENGARAFGAYAKEMISDLGDAIRPYLKAFYNGARDLPEMTELSSEMTPYDEVSRFDVATIGNEGKQLTPSAIETAEQINNEATVEFNAKQEQSNTNELEDVDNDAYSITKQHNNKKDVDIWVVRGKERTDKDVYTQRKQVAKEHNGYYSSFRGVNGFVFNSAEEAHSFADAIFNTHSEENHAQISEEIMRKDILNREDTENQEKNSDEDIASEEKITDRKDAEEPTEQSTNSRLLAQYNALKEKYPDTKILLRVGDFYETYQDDAKDLSKTLGIVLTKRNDGVNMVGFPYHTLDTYLPKLIRAGYRVAINDKDKTANDTPTSNGLEGRFTSAEDIEGNLFNEVDFSDSPNKNVNQAISKLTDNELLKEIAKGDSKEWNFYMEEYDRRHNKEFQEAVERYMNSLEDEKTSLDTAYGSYVNVAKNWSNGGYHTTERTLLRAQLDAIEDYVSKKESEQLSSVESEAYHQAKETVRKVGYDLTRLRLRPLEEGEVCHVERRYTESNGFSFTGKEHIESIEDIAYIFKQLETSSVENSFLVLIKDGTPTVLHLSIGSYATALAPIEQAIVAADAINPDKVLFVHNHPSGNISASKQDMDVQKKMKEIFGGKVMPAIIINTTSGKFGMFSEDGRLEDGNIPLPDEHNNIPINVYQFSQQVFAKDWNPEFAFRAVSPESIAEYVSSHRLGEHKKMSLIILDQAGHVTGNVFLPWTKLTDVDSHKNIMQIISYVNQMGGRSAILYGNYELGEDTRDTNKSIFKIKTAFSNSALHLMDVINIDDSALDRGAMEEDVEYGKRNLDEEKYREGYGSYTNSELSFINDPVAKMLGKSNRTKEDHKAFAERERQRMISRISELADRLHLDNIETVTDSNSLQGKKAKAKGFYSKSSGNITIVIPNHASVEDVEKTLLHEAVAHYGLRKLFGEHFETFLDNVYQNVEPEIRRIITRQAANNNWDFRTATEEYLAGLAERTDFERVHYAIWNKIKSLFLKMFHSIGFEGWSATELSDNELRYLLWRSYENMKEPGRYRSILGEAEDIAKQNELKVGNYDQQDTNSSNVAERGILYREDDSKEKERVNAREQYEQRVNRAMFQTQEALQDSMLGLKEAMNAITKAEGKNVNIEDIDGYENAYLGENRLSSVNKAEADAFAHLLFKPMLAEVSKLCKNAQERTELVDYMMAKHGLERNAVMRKRAIEDILNNEKLSDAQKSARAGLAEYRDYAGLTALTGKDNVTEAEVDAETMVSEYENTHDTTNLWDKVNAVNAAILSKSYECGMMDKDTYEKISDMYKYYIPLRGFDETTSEEAYAYLLHQSSAFNAPIKVAKGRSSKADDPFANMQSMAESAITQGNRNKLVKQRFFNFVLNHPSDLVSISDMWLKYDDVADEWKPVFPDNFEENDSAEDIEQKLKEFEDKMKKLAEQAPDKYKHGKETTNIPYRVVDSRDLHQHQVLVKRGGRDYILTLNGNPRAAQALNGQTNPDNDTSGAIGAILKAGEMVNRQLSAFYTTRNPDFVVSNFIRDMLFSNSIVWVKESPNYALRFHRNIARCNPAQIKVLLAKHRKGTLDMNNKLEHMFYQFMMNGGETGYANVRDIEQHKNDIRRELKRANGKLSITKAFNLLGEKLDEYNRAVENCARFAAYLTSREMGRTVERSIYDAKEISVNFNKKGSGAKFMNAVGQTKIGTASAFVSGIGRSGFVFWNAAIQGTTNFGRQFKKHPAKAFTASAIMFLLGAVIAGIGMGDGDDDADANSYWNLPEYVRRSNILFKIGDQWVSIPLPVEYRAIYGMGELMVSAMSGKEHFTGSELGKAIAGQATQVLPIDFLEGGGGVKAFVPSAVKPFAEVYSNKGWTGMPIYKDTPYNKYMPEWTKAYKSANKYLVGIAKTLNEATGGDAYTKGSVDINPAQIEYLLNGYFGGVSGTIDKLSKSAETIAGDREYDPRNFLLLNRILKNGDERTEARAINNEYMRVKEEHDVLKARMKHYENDTDKGLFDYADKIDFLYNSPEFARYEIFEDYSKDIDALYQELKEANDGAEHLSIEKELTELKKEMIEEMNKTRK